jgi:hypothetical protein
MGPQFELSNRSCVKSETKQDIIIKPTELSPEALGGGRRVMSISGGEHHSLFLLSDGSVWGCGWSDGPMVRSSDCLKITLRWMVLLPRGPRKVILIVPSTASALNLKLHSFSAHHPPLASQHLLYTRMRRSSILISPLHSILSHVYPLVPGIISQSPGQEASRVWQHIPVGTWTGC